jgi:hypothetical protein
MARIRSIKPSFWTDEKLGNLPRDVRLLYIGIISALCDDEGRARANPKLIRASVFPYDEFTVPEVEAMLVLLARAERVQLYEDHGQHYLAVDNFKRHQKIDKPQPSTLPAPPDRSGNSRDHSENVRRTFGEQCTGDGMGGEEEGNGSGMDVKEDAAAPRVERQKRASRKAKAPQSALPATLDECIDARPVAGPEQPDAPDLPAEPKPERFTWLTPYVGPWEKRFGAGSFPFGKAAKALCPFKGRPPEEERDRLDRYLEATDAKYASLHRFAETHDSWTDAAEDYNTTDRSRPDFVGVVDGWMSAELERITRPS